MVSVEMVYGSELGYFNTSDIVKPAKYTIMGYYIMTFGNDSKRKVVLILKDEKKRFVLNKTNAFKIASKYGQDANAWTGKEIVIEPASIMFNGKEIKTLSVI